MYVPTIRVYTILDGTPIYTFVFSAADPHVGTGLPTLSRLPLGSFARLPWILSARPTDASHPPPLSCGDSNSNVSECRRRRFHSHTRLNAAAFLILSTSHPPDPTLCQAVTFFLHLSAPANLPRFFTLRYSCSLHFLIISAHKICVPRDLQQPSTLLRVLSRHTKYFLRHLLSCEGHFFSHR